MLILNRKAIKKLFWASAKPALGNQRNAINGTLPQSARVPAVPGSPAEQFGVLSLWLAEPGAAPCLYLLAQLADQLGVVVVGFDHLSLATGHQGSTLNQVRPQGALGKENLLGFQVHLPDDLVGNLQQGHREEELC